MAMNIGNFGEFQQLRRSASKEDMKANAAARAYQAAEPEAKAADKEQPRGDAVSISPEARRLGRLSQLPDARADVVADARARLDAGGLDTPEAVERGTRNMLAALFGDDL